MIKNGVTIKKENNKISFYSVTEQNGCTYLYTKPFTLGEYLYFRDARSMAELHSFHGWGKNPRLDKTIKRVIKMCKYMEKDLEASKDYYLPEVMQYATKKRDFDIER